MSATIEIHKNGTSIRAQSGRRKLKNRGLQSMCRTTLMPNSKRIRNSSPEEDPLVQAETPAHPASARITVHAGPKIESGGFQAGFCRSRYQGPTVVIQAPKPSMRRTIPAAIMIGITMSGHHLGLGEN